MKNGVFAHPPIPPRPYPHPVRWARERAEGRTSRFVDHEGYGADVAAVGSGAGPGERLEEIVHDFLTTRDGIVVRAQTVPADQVLTTWQQFVEEFPSSGLWPVVLGHGWPSADDTIQQLVAMSTSTHTPPMQDILLEAAVLDVDAFLQSQWEGGYPLPELRGTTDDTEALDESPPSHPVSAFRPELIPTEGDAVILLMPVVATEDALALLGWGDWNACPPAAAHVALLREWRTRYGAQLLALCHDTLELLVARPPLTFDDALELARAQFSYTEDIIAQGNHATVGELAAALVGSRHWHFWWD